MLRILRQIHHTGLLSESPTELEAVGREARRIIDERYSGSLAIRQVDAGSCNACELEIHALNNPYYAIERFGFHFVASPRHADILLVTGPVTRHMEAALLRTWDAVPAPKWLVAAGDCAACGGEFGASYACRGGLSGLLPVDASIPGCPPAPADLLRGLLSLIRRG
ncbi:MAG: hydrogenase [Gammaproteobacteria bacterium]|nr:MAG: hydrogenase [Gammaproteobacteria bacterium]